MQQNLIPMAGLIGASLLIGGSVCRNAIMLLFGAALILTTAILLATGGDK